MAKFKKRKTKPISDPEDSPSLKKDERTGDEENSSINTDIKKVDTPPTEDVVAESESNKKSPDPKKVHTLSDSEVSESKKKLDRLFWLRIGLATIAGIAATFLFSSIEDFEERRWSSIIFMIAVFIGSVFVGKAMRIQLASSDRKKLVTNGLGSYVFIYLFVWIVTYTIVNSGNNDMGITTPFP